MFDNSDFHLHFKSYHAFFKGATRLNFLYYLRVVSILFITGLWKPAFSAYF